MASGYRGKGTEEPGRLIFGWSLKFSHGIAWAPRKQPDLMLGQECHPHAGTPRDKFMGAFLNHRDLDARQQVSLRIKY